MAKTHVLIGLLATATSAACGAADGVADAGRPPDAGAPTADAVPFTSGVSTLAGAAEPGDVDGDRSVARFSDPVNVLLGGDGVLYVADFDNGLVRTVDRAGNVATLVRQAGFERPFGLAMSAAGTLYVQTDNDPQGGHSSTSGTIWRVGAGAATVVATHLGRPRGLAVLADGRIAMADEQRHVIQLLDPATGAVRILAGALDEPGYVDATGPAARFRMPYGIAIRGDGKLVVADYGNQRLRLVDVATAATTTLAGRGVAGFVDGALDRPRSSICRRASRSTAPVTIYVTDTGNYRIRRVRGDLVDTVAGDGIGGYLDADDRLAAELYGLEGVAVSPDGLARVRRRRQPRRGGPVQPGPHRRPDAVVAPARRRRRDRSPSADRAARAGRLDVPVGQGRARSGAASRARPIAA